MRAFVGCIQNLADGESTKFCKFLEAAQLILHVTDKHTILPVFAIEITQIKFPG